MHLSKGPSVRRWSGTGSYNDLRVKAERPEGLGLMANRPLSFSCGGADACGILFKKGKHFFAIIELYISTNVHVH